MIELTNPGHVLGLSLEHWEASRHKRTQRESNERLWPSEILEDILDTEIVACPLPTCPTWVSFVVNLT
jgi:hypothetical protein